MTALFKKLNYKSQDSIVILNSPMEFSDEQKAMSAICNVENDSNKIEDIEFVLSFVQTVGEVNSIISSIAPKVKGDAVVWFAYPKKTSKKYKAEINRDFGWDMLGNFGFEAVRAVAIDEDWSALRFRKVEYIKTMKRKKLRAMTDEGKKRIKNS